MSNQIIEALEERDKKLCEFYDLQNPLRRGFLLAKEIVEKTIMEYHLPAAGLSEQWEHLPKEHLIKIIYKLSAALAGSGQEWKELYRKSRHQLEYIFICLQGAIREDKPLNEHDLYRTTKHILKETPSIGLTD
jgi:hypothetical protein